MFAGSGLLQQVVRQSRREGILDLGEGGASERIGPGLEAGP
jgi:hypothetical protein